MSPEEVARWEKQLPHVGAVSCGLGRVASREVAVAPSWVRHRAARVLAFGLRARVPPSAGEAGAEARRHRAVTLGACRQARGAAR